MADQRSNPASRTTSSAASTREGRHLDQDGRPTDDGPASGNTVTQRLSAIVSEVTAKASQKATEATERRGAKPVKRTRRARLRIVRVDPWSVMKMAFMFSIAFGIMLVVMVAVIWGVLEAAGVFESINSTVGQVLGSEDEFNIEDVLGADRVIGFSVLIAAVDVVLITAIATLGAFLYNVSAQLLGGLEITLQED